MDMSEVTREDKDSKLRTSKPGKPRGRLHRLSTSQIPIRLRAGSDVDEDVTAPGRAGTAASQYMNQSIFSMIAAAGSRTNFNKRFDESSGSEADDASQAQSKSTLRSRQSARSRHDTARSRTPVSQKDSGSYERRSVARPLGQRSPAVPEAPENEETLTQHEPTAAPEDVPMMSRILTAEAEDRISRPAAEADLLAHDGQPARESSRATTEALESRVMRVFGLESPETVVAEYRCWLLQNVLLQGYLYITQHHLCFFAYIPPKTNAMAKTGYVSKRGKSNPKYNRYWFTLKGDILTYYSAPSDVYFPRGHIDLRYGISATISSPASPAQDSKDFSVVTDQGSYHFRADSSVSAEEWVKALRKTMFRSRNDSNSVKISIPLSDILDVDNTPMVEYAETIKVRVIESEDTYAMDEYFFTFFQHGNDALDALSKTVRSEATAQKALPDNRGNRHSPKRPDSRQSGLQPKARVQDAAFDQPGRSRASIQHSTRVDGRDQVDATDPSVISSTDRETESSAATASPTAEAKMSASQILDRSDVFDNLVVRRMETLDSESSSDHDRRLDEHRPSANAVPAAKDDKLSPSVSPIAVRRSDALPHPIMVTDLKSAAQNTALPRDASSPTLQDLVKAGTYLPTQAARVGGYLKDRSSVMSRYLAAESMSYLEKVSGMWAGGHQHYGHNEGVVVDEPGIDPDDEDEDANVGHGDRFRAHFALSPSEKLQATYFGYLHRVLPLYGKIYISGRRFCFRSLLPGTRTKLVLPLPDIENAHKEKGFRFGYHGLVIVIRGHEELFFEFKRPDTRDDCAVTLHHSLNQTRSMETSGLLESAELEQESVAEAEHRLLREGHQSPFDGDREHDVRSGTEATIAAPLDSPPVRFDDPKASILQFEPPAPLRITCLTIGSRGDVQPYISLCKGLLADGHRPHIATHEEFGPWVRSHGIDFTPIGGDPAELMRICVENGMFTYSFLREASTKFRSWLDDLLTSSWAACADTDLLIESPSAMAGIHIAEALGIPYIRAFTMPWTRTRAYPHAFAVPENKIGGAYNFFSYVMFDNIFWKGIASQVNRWRKAELGLRPTSLDKLQPNKVPFLYNYSPQVVAPPLDYSDWVRVTGYWFLDEGGDYVPPAELSAFIVRARADKKKLVYIGFGSIVVSDPQALTQTIIDSVVKADVRCILSKGWSDRLGDPSSTRAELPLPPEIFQIKSAPHDWLFCQVDAAVHHGGAGTTGASLRAGIPTVVKPFFGDQFFFGGRVEDLGVGMLLRKINVSVLARALWESCHSERMKDKARRLGEAIRQENGVRNAIQAIYRDLEYATTIVRARQALSKPVVETAPAELSPGSEGITTTLLDYETEADLEGEESWTFLGSEDDMNAELRRRLTSPVARSSLDSDQP